MTYMLCRNTVRDFSKWFGIFRAHKEAHRQAGLILEYLWQDSDDPNTVRFLFRVDDLQKAQSFIAAPEAGAAASDSGVLDGDYHFINAAGGY